MFVLFRKLLQVAVASFNIFHWLTLAIIIISLFHYVYGKAIKKLLLKVGLKNEFVVPFVDTIWHLSFMIISLLMIFVCFGDSILGNWVARLDNELTKCKLHQETTVEGTRSIFILLTAFALHDIINTLITKGFKNLEFFQKQVFFAIFVLTCYSKCTMFGLSLYFISNWATVVELGSKLFFFVSQYTKSNSLQTVTKILYSLSVSLWMYTYFYIYPMFLTHNKSVNSAMMKAELNMLIVLDFLTWVYLIVTIIISMFTRMVLSYTLPSEGRPQALVYFLFGCDPWILWLTRSQGTILSDKEIFMSLAQRHMRTLRATIKCRNSIMRKVNRMRAEKEERMSLMPTEEEGRPSRFSISLPSPYRAGGSRVSTTSSRRSRSRSRSTSPPTR